MWKKQIKAIKTMNEVNKYGYVYVLTKSDTLIDNGSLSFSKKGKTANIKLVLPDYIVGLLLNENTGTMTYIKNRQDIILNSEELNSYRILLTPSFIQGYKVNKARKIIEPTIIVHNDTQIYSNLNIYFPGND